MLKFVIGFILLFSTALFSEGITIQVTTTQDELILNSQCSLREAIQLVNGFTSADCIEEPNEDQAFTIQLGEGIYNISLVGSDGKLNSYNNRIGDFDLFPLDSLLIRGNENGNTIIDAVKNDRIFDINDSVITLENLTLQNGSTSESGGAIRSERGNLTLNFVRILNNISLANGGGVSFHDTVGLFDSVEISKNQAKNYGGGIYIFNSDYDINEKNGNINWIYATLVVKQSTIADNILTSSLVKSKGGGGVYINGVGYDIDFVNSTITNHSEEGVKVMINSENFENGYIGFSGSTISNNSYGILFQTRTLKGPGTMLLESSIFADNLIYDIESYLEGHISSYGNNLIENPGPHTDFYEVVDYLGIDPKLGDLVDNGGFTKTRMIANDSIARDNGSCSTLPITGYSTKNLVDQRNYSRPTSGCDIGSVELQPEEL